MEEKEKCKGFIYQVQKGDTLYKIAKKYRNKVKVRDLILANPYVDVYNLKIGDELCIPIMKDPSDENTKPYRAVKNETLGSVLKKTRLTFDQLLKYNPSLLDLPVKEGNILLIPEYMSTKAVEDGMNSDKKE